MKPIILVFGVLLLAYQLVAADSKREDHDAEPAARWEIATVVIKWHNNVEVGRKESITTVKSREACKNESAVILDKWKENYPKHTNPDVYGWLFKHGLAMYRVEVSCSYVDPTQLGVTSDSSSITPPADASALRLYYDDISEDVIPRSRLRSLQYYQDSCAGYVPTDELTEGNILLEPAPPLPPEK